MEGKKVRAQNWMQDMQGIEHHMHSTVRHKNLGHHVIFSRLITGGILFIMNMSQISKNFCASQQMAA